MKIATALGGVFTMCAAALVCKDASAFNRYYDSSFCHPANSSSYSYLSVTPPYGLSNSDSSSAHYAVCPIISDDTYDFKNITSVDVRAYNNASNSTQVQACATNSYYQGSCGGWVGSGGPGDVGIPLTTSNGGLSAWTSSNAQSYDGASLYVELGPETSCGSFCFNYDEIYMYYTNQ